MAIIEKILNAGGTGPTASHGVTSNPICRFSLLAEEITDLDTILFWELRTDDILHLTDNDLVATLQAGLTTGGTYDIAICSRAGEIYKTILSDLSLDAADVGGSDFGLNFERGYYTNEFESLQDIENPVYLCVVVTDAGSGATDSVVDVQFRYSRQGQIELYHNGARRGTSPRWTEPVHRGVAAIPVQRYRYTDPALDTTCSFNLVHPNISPQTDGASITSWSNEAGSGQFQNNLSQSGGTGTDFQAANSISGSPGAFFQAVPGSIRSNQAASPTVYTEYILFTTFTDVTFPRTVLGIIGNSFWYIGFNAGVLELGNTAQGTLQPAGGTIATETTYLVTVNNGNFIRLNSVEIDSSGFDMGTANTPVIGSRSDASGIFLGTIHGHRSYFGVSHSAADALAIERDIMQSDNGLVPFA